ncbi:hypothetical protein BX600DRAFT_447235 [Xylariales sp. PMI_506]|nr:hypothetical protein BX600DRAFT_447235 [Xylariales sp. PMI_506]
MLGELVRDQLSSQEQVSAFQDSYDLLRESFEKMTISRRIERFLSGTTVVEENADGAETEAGDSGGPAAISPGLIHHPGYGFPRLNPGDIMVPRAALTRVDVWVQGTREAAVVIVGGGGGGGRGRKQAKANSNDSDNRLLCVQLPRYASDSGKAMAAAHALCTQLIKAIALRCSPGRRKLLCYNGLPPEKEPRVPGCYTIRHAVWFLTGQVLIPRPHLDGAMPPEEKAYEPHVEAVCDEIREIRVKAEEKNRHRGGGTGAELEVFIVLFLPLEKMDPAGADRELHERLIRNFKELTTQSEYIRLLLFTDDNDNGVLENFPVEAMFPFPSSGEEVSLAEWKASVGDDSDDDMDI